VLKQVESVTSRNGARTTDSQCEPDVIAAGIDSPEIKRSVFVLPSTSVKNQDWYL
jgi:hypothetical protein